LDAVKITHDLCELSCTAVSLYLTDFYAKFVYLSMDSSAPKFTPHMAIKVQNETKIVSIPNSFFQIPYLYDCTSNADAKTLENPTPYHGRTRSLLINGCHRHCQLMLIQAIAGIYHLSTGLRISQYCTHVGNLEPSSIFFSIVF